jgi:pimeloyl-ACP methyl ester carboxylesterase
VNEIEIVARGLTFDALTDGPSDGPLLILLHGLPRNRWEWHHQIPAMAELGFRVVAPDLRGFCEGARPEGVEAYHVDEYACDVLAIADALGHESQPFHLMGTSIGSVIAWWLAAKHPDRVATLVGINIPHPGALATGRSGTATTGESQDAKFDYMVAAAQAGNERTVFEAMLAGQGVPPEESAPYRTALDSDDALRAVYHWYRAIPLWSGERLGPVPMPTLFIWPTGSTNVAAASVEANADWVTGPYRLEIVEDVHQPALQAAPERLTPLLLEHLSEHARPKPETRPAT